MPPRKVKFPQEGIEELALRVLSGQAVFLVGAGFSLDAEGNSARRLMGRLLARFEAMSGYLERHGSAKATALREGLVRVFQLDGAEPCLLAAKTIEKLAGDYYSINDWLSVAFAGLLAEMREPLEAAAAEIHETENRLLSEHTRESEPLEAIELPAFLKLKTEARGKALFLHTMGFANPRIMAGAPEEPDPGRVAESYHGRLLERHHVLARLAREGLSPLLLTANFDLLLEGAYRLSGFFDPEARTEHLCRLPPTSFQHYSRIARAADFLQKGSGHRTALIIKIHGCAETYRQAARETESWQHYLPSMVFTYREIQNWRNDKWSRDLVNTLARTRTMVFCGYSGIDPVMHDTFRTVYEEMQGRPNPGSATAEKAPAFFLGVQDKTEFHGMEILRAASCAAGVAEPDLTGHPNYLRFFVQGNGERRFPSQDEVLLWLYHRVFRSLQERALESDLRRMASLLLGRRVREAQLEAVRGQFRTLVDAERAAAGGWDEDPRHRRRFHRVAGWSYRFQVGLLREMALAETVVRNEGAGLELARLRLTPWYYPASEHPGWTAWSAVVEIALRRMIAARSGQPASWMRESAAEPAACQLPAVLFRDPGQATPACLAIRLAGFQRAAQAPPIQGVARRQVFWELPASARPWRDRDAEGGRDPTPGAEVIWNWARYDATAPPDAARLPRYFGETDERRLPDA